GAAAQLRASLHEDAPARLVGQAVHEQVALGGKVVVQTADAQVGGVRSRAHRELARADGEDQRRGRFEDLALAGQAICRRAAGFTERHCGYLRTIAGPRRGALPRAGVGRMLDGVWTDHAATRRLDASPYVRRPRCSGRSKGGSEMVSTTDTRIDPPRSGASFELFGSTLTARVTAADTHGDYALIEYDAPPGLPGAPTHLHEHTEEYIFV